VTYDRSVVFSSYSSFL